MKIRTTLVATLLAFLFSASLASAADAPKPGAEHKRLDYYVGTWTIDANAAASPFGPAGKVTGKQVFERGPGGFSVTLRGDVKTPGGSIQSVAVLSYDSHKKAYLYAGVDSMGIVGSATGTIDGPKWTWSTEDHVAGKSVKGRFTINETS